MSLNPDNGVTSGPRIEPQRHYVNHLNVPRNLRCFSVVQKVRVPKLASASVRVQAKASGGTVSQTPRHHLRGRPSFRVFAPFLHQAQYPFPVRRKIQPSRKDFLICDDRSYLPRLRIDALQPSGTGLILDQPGAVRTEHSATSRHRPPRLPLARSVFAGDVKAIVCSLPSQKGTVRGQLQTRVGARRKWKRDSLVSPRAESRWGGRLEVVDRAGLVIPFEKDDAAVAVKIDFLNPLPGLRFIDQQAWGRILCRDTKRGDGIPPARHRPRLPSRYRISQAGRKSNWKSEAPIPCHWLNQIPRGLWDTVRTPDVPCARSARSAQWNGKYQNPKQTRPSPPRSVTKNHPIFFCLPKPRSPRPDAR